MIRFLTEKKEIFIVIIIFFIFLFLRIPAIHSPYHQDEYKWPLYSNPEVYLPGSVPHPPLTEFIYRVIAPNFGYENFRLVPLIFSVFNIFLLFCLSKIIFGKRTALWTIFIFTVSYFSILASLMIDVDGAVMPFFFLLSAMGYFKFKESQWKNWKWGALMLVGVTGGFLVKVSSILPTIALSLDFILDKKIFEDRKKILKYLFYTIGAILAFIILLVLIKFIFPFFDLSKAIKYWEHFAVFKDRGWFQTLVQFAKAIFYLSPLLVLPVFLINKDIWQKARPLFFFIFIGLFFYLFVFDFSLGALDRYLQFLIIPLCIISGAVYSNYLASLSLKREMDKLVIVTFVIVAIIFIKLQWLTQVVSPQYPKTEWITRALSLKWAFLFPFSGGSGPIGFYLSFSFIASCWLFTTSLLSKKRKFLIGIFIIGLSYNLIFTGEYLFGKINGSAKGLLNDSIAYIKEHPEVKNIVVYNDNGGWDIRSLGLYNRRMYATPQFEDSYREFLKNFSGYVLYINIPRLDPNSFYAKYFDSCDVVYQKSDLYITSKILNCLQNKK